MNPKEPLNNFDTSWQKVADWYKDVPKQEESYHNLVIIPNVLDKLEKFVGGGGKGGSAEGNYAGGGKVVDIACGEGTVTKRIKDAGYNPIGMELSQDLVNNARHNYPEINFVKEDARNFSDGFKKSVQGCDAVVCVLALQNIDSLEPVVENVSEILKEGGIFIAILNHPYFRIPKVTRWDFEGHEKQNRVVEKCQT
jgi:SAM-dependent methyltransferase